MTEQQGDPDARPPVGSEMTYQDIANETFLATGRVVTAEAVERVLRRAGVTCKLHRND